MLGALLMGGGGDGRAWRREQKDVLEHAKQLGYDRDGGSIIAETDDKAEWEKWRDGFVGWKNKNVALEKEGRAFWQQPRQKEPSMARAPAASAAVLSPIQQSAAVNRNFPMLISKYTPPQAFDYSAYTSMSPFGGMGGLLYNPGTDQYRKAFPMADNLLYYQPPELGFPQVSYANPNILDVSEVGHGGGGSDKKKKDKKKNGDPGSEEGRDSRYGGDGPGVDVSKAVAGLFGLQDFAEWGDPVFGDDDDTSSSSGDDDPSPDASMGNPHGE